MTYTGGWQKIAGGQDPHRHAGARWHGDSADQARAIHHANGLVKLGIGGSSPREAAAKGLVCLPSDNILREVSLSYTNYQAGELVEPGIIVMPSDPLPGKVT